MSHNHSHHNSSNNIAVAFFLNLGFTIIEIIGGIFTNSLAIMSDALHDLGDSISLGLAWYFEKLSNKKPTKEFTFGFKRFSILGAIINSIILFLGSIYIIVEAIPRIIKPEVSDAKGMMWLAFLGILVNGAAVFKLKQGKSLNEKVVYLHLIEDVLGWIAILIASILMQFWELPRLDPVLSLLIAMYILSNIYKNIKESIRIVLQGTPKNTSIDLIKNSLLNFDEIIGVHDCHIWSMDGDYDVFTSHIIVRSEFSNLQSISQLKNKIKNLLHNKFHLEHITLEFEVEVEECNYTLVNKELKL